MKEFRDLQTARKALQAGARCLAVMAFAIMLPAVMNGPGSAQAQGGAYPAAQAAYVDLRPQFDRWQLDIKRQGRRDTCAVFAIIGAYEYALAKKQNRGTRLSEEYLNWAANDIAGAAVDGASFAELLMGFDRWGIARDDQMPYLNRFSPRNEPSDEALETAKNIWQMGFKRHWISRNGLSQANLQSVKNVISKGYPVCAEAKHCLLLVGYADDPRQPGGGTFITRNSAMERYEYMPYAEAAAKFSSLVWVELPKK